ncbi:hypothetical protein Y032_0118g756 [Ancylostoma ceylanicum]|uniref:Fungal lipase-type domain-containing protein n=2 Tax=Ancylostoma ceylanicum TaxID=53326 RepID=A0A016TAW9_9BILA|nr:hypothetical protein Y032_0118g756 [Ancylostoma ceylanicum]
MILLIILSLASLGSCINYSDYFARNISFPLSAAVYSSDTTGCLRKHLNSNAVKASSKFRAEIDGGFCAGIVVTLPRYRMVAVSFRANLSKPSQEESWKEFLFPLTTWKHKGQVSAFLKKAFEALWEKEGMKEKFQEIMKRMNGNKFDEVVVTGHSFGGGIASLVAYDIVASGLLQKDKVTLFTLGQTMVGDKAFAEDYEKQVEDSYRIVRKGDFVPHLPGVVFGYEYNGKEVYYVEPGMDSDGESGFKMCERKDIKKEGCSGGQVEPVGFRQNNEYFNENLGHHQRTLVPSIGSTHSPRKSMVLLIVLSLASVGSCIKYSDYFARNISFPLNAAVYSSDTTGCLRKKLRLSDAIKASSKFRADIDGGFCAGIVVALPRYKMVAVSFRANLSKPSQEESWKKFFFPLTTWKHKGKVSAFLKNAFEALWEKGGMKEKFQEIMKRRHGHKFKEVVVTGHSFGGGVASLVAYDIVATGLLEKKKVTLFTLGQTMVEDKTFAEEYEKQVQSTPSIHRQELGPRLGFPPCLCPAGHDASVQLITREPRRGEGIYKGNMYVRQPIAKRMKRMEMDRYPLCFPTYGQIYWMRLQDRFKQLQGEAIMLLCLSLNSSLHQLNANRVLVDWLFRLKF